MNALRNNVQLIGHIANEPEIKNLDGGKKLANITIVTTEEYFKENGDKGEQTFYHRVSAWGKTADFIEKNIIKGQEVAAEGKLSHRSYDDKDGQKRYITEVIANDLFVLGK